MFIALIPRQFSSFFSSSPIKQMSDKGKNNLTIQLLPRAIKYKYIYATYLKPGKKFDIKKKNKALEAASKDIFYPNIPLQNPQ